MTDLDSAPIMDFPDISQLENKLPNNPESDDDDEPKTGSFHLPDSVKALQAKLLDDYHLAPSPPASVGGPPKLDASQKLSLRHYIAWKLSNGTVNGYKLHAQVLHEATRQDILSLHAVRKLALDITGLQPQQIDICPQSCIAYTGEYKTLTSSYI